jgi:hypothetical protein
VASFRGFGGGGALLGCDRHGDWDHGGYKIDKKDTFLNKEI